jgi:hypothetical protein
MRQRTAKPTKKVVTGGVTGLIASVIVYAVLSVWHVDLPLEVAGWIAGIIVALAGWLAAYLVPPSRDDEPVPTARRRRDPIN